MNLKLCLASIGTAFCLLAGTPSSAWAGALENAKAAYDAKNYSEEAKWAKIAAEQGNAVAQFNLGVLYANGQGVRQDYQEAAKWYRKAVEQGIICQNNFRHSFSLTWSGKTCDIRRSL